MAPRIASSEILVETKLSNRSDAPASFDLVHDVRTWKGREKVASADSEKITLAPGEARTVRKTVTVRGAHLWSPEDPFLYLLATSTGGDSMVTRFGMREFRFDTATKRAYLNGKVYFLRGSNITLHRFFEDPLSRDLPWDEALGAEAASWTSPRKMHWNSVPVLHRPGARPVARDCGRDGPSDPERVLHLDRGPRVEPAGTPVTGTRT